MSINAFHLQAKCELQAQRCIISSSSAYMHIYIYIYSSRYLVIQLQDVINKLASPQHPHMSRMSVHAPSEGKPDALIIPDAPKPLDEEDYPDVQYWHNRDWINHTK